MAGLLQTILLRQGRNIGGILPNVTISEQHTDTLTITDHPVELGAQISDHAYKMPSELVMQVGWSDSSLALTGVISGIVSGTLLSGSAIQSVRDVYKQLLALQESRIPFDVVTGKRSYRNMLIRSIAVTTDQATEAALMATVTMRQVIIVETSTTALKVKAQSKPSATAPTQDGGTVSPKPVAAMPGGGK